MTADVRFCRTHVEITLQGGCVLILTQAAYRAAIRAGKGQKRAERLRQRTYVACEPTAEPNEHSEGGDASSDILDGNLPTNRGEE